MEEIYAAGGKLDLAITLTDDKAVKKSGRVYIDDFCAAHEIDLVKINHVNDEDSLAAIKRREIDWLFIIGWSQIAGQAVLDAPNRGVLGIHPTLLPKGRGRAPIPWAIIKGLESTGVTLFKLDAGVDTGDILAQEILPLAANETATILYERVNDAHRTIIKNIWPKLANDSIVLKKQDESQAEIWEGRKPEDGRITRQSTVQQADRLIRGTTRPYPGAFYQNSQGEFLRIWSGHIGDPAFAPAYGVERIELADGIYDATEYDWE
jgi:methionyl-tRNA formyltransferase